MFPDGNPPQQSSRQYNSQHQILGTEEILQIDEEACQKHLDTITQSDTSHDDKKNCRLPPLELSAFLDANARDIERQQNQEHRYRKVVWHDDRQQDICHRESEHRHQRRVVVSESDDLTKDAKEKDIRIE